VHRIDVDRADQYAEHVIVHEAALAGMEERDEPTQDEKEKEWQEELLAETRERLSEMLRRCE
jgi:hypothetical protein